MKIQMNLIENSKDYVINALELFHVADEYGTHVKEKTDRKETEYATKEVDIVSSRTT